MRDPAAMPLQSATKNFFLRTDKLAARFWTAAVFCRFSRARACDSGRGLPQSKTPRRWREPSSVQDPGARFENRKFSKHIQVAATTGLAGSF